MQWYIVHTYSGFEESASKETLRQRADALGMADSFGEVRIPTETIVELKGGKKRETQRKFFPAYILVQMDMSDASLARGEEHSQSDRIRRYRQETDTAHPGRRSMASSSR